MSDNDPITRRSPKKGAAGKENQKKTHRRAVSGTSVPAVLGLLMAYSIALFLLGLPIGEIAEAEFMTCLLTVQVVAYVARPAGTLPWPTSAMVPFSLPGMNPSPVPPARHDRGAA